MARTTAHACLAGWVCEEHPDRPWPHDGCAGPIMSCEFPGCSFVKDGKPSLPREWVPLIRAIAPHADMIRNGLWVFASIMWATAIVGAVVLWRSL
jgi:hypothetical protein